MKDWEVEWFGNQVFKDIKRLVDGSEKVAAARIVRDAKRFCPKGKWERDIYTRGKYSGKEWTGRKPGRLRDSIRMYPSKYKDGGYTVFAGDEIAFYARFVELGTPGAIQVRRPLRGSKHTVSRTPIPKAPFLRRALKLEQRRFYIRLKGVFGMAA